MKAPEMEEVPSKMDFFKALDIPCRRLQLSESQVYIELHPSNSGPLAKLSKAPVLVAKALTVTVTPDAACTAGARIEAEIDVDGIEVISPDFSEVDKDRIKRKLRADLLQSDVFPLILFQVLEVSVHPDGTSVLANWLLTIHGRSVEQFIRFKRTSPKTYEANIAIRQTAFGLKPLTAMMGGLKSDDRLGIRCVIYLGAANTTAKASS